jgi:hypothetical protein
MHLPSRTMGFRPGEEHKLRFRAGPAARYRQEARLPAWLPAAWPASKVGVYRRPPYPDGPQPGQLSYQQQSGGESRPA